MLRNLKRIDIMKFGEGIGREKSRVKEERENFKNEAENVELIELHLDPKLRT